jgi:hypothetical protein
MRVLRMVAVLHGKGFHGLRAFMYEYPLAYRIELFPAQFADRGGIKHTHLEVLERDRLLARHTGANGDRYFGWDDVSGLSAEELALIFLRRFPELAGAAYQLDFAYAGWFATLLSHCEYGYLPYLFSEHEPDIGTLRMRAVGKPQLPTGMDWFPSPPTPSHGVQFSANPRPGWMPGAD